MLRTQLSVLKKLTRRTSVNSIEMKRHIAARVIEAEHFSRSADAVYFNPQSSREAFTKRIR